MDTHCFEEATHASVELAESQCQGRELMDRGLDHFVVTYEPPDWHQHWLPQRADSLPSQGWAERLAPSSWWDAMVHSKESSQGATGTGVPQEGP